MLLLKIDWRCSKLALKHDDISWTTLWAWTDFQPDPGLGAPNSPQTGGTWQASGRGHLDVGRINFGVNLDPD